MNLKAAERATGCDVNVIEADGQFFVSAIEHGRELAITQGPELKPVLRELVERVYKIRSAQARERDDYRCCRCGKLLPLSQHHVNGRTRGRRDDTQTISLCMGCHQKEHEG